MNGDEFFFIEGLRKNFFNDGPEVGIGDDCAVIPYNDGEVYLLSTDCLVEGVHFNIKDISLEGLGWKSVAVSLSDIAAMGGEARYVWITVGWPRDWGVDLLNIYYEGVSRIINRYGVKLLGGDTTCSMRGLWLSVTVMGVVRRGEVLFRGNVRVGDWIYVTGTLGDSALTCDMMLKEESVLPELVKRYHYPFPRLREMEYINRKYDVSSAIDISDGISGDLRHLIGNNDQVKAVIEWAKLPVSDIFMEVTEGMSEEERGEYILHGGEDYEILFTSSDGIDTEGFYKDFGVELSLIGGIKISSGNYDKDEIILLKEGIEERLGRKSYNHFAK